MSKDISNYTEFVEALNNDIEDRFVLILDYPDLEFQVYRDTLALKYYYVECGENDASDFWEVELVAVLSYDINHDLKIDHAGEYLHGVFDCDICGEWVDDDNLHYMWFKKITE